MKKKSVFSLCGMIVLIMVLTANVTAAKTNPPEASCQGSVKTDGCPRVWVEVTPAFISHSPADHTYIKFLEHSGHWQGFPCFGACDGGKELPDTKSATWEDNKKIVQYMADAAPCKWPDNAYLVVGVCHQLANRGLFHTGNIVKNARMYKWSSFVYQTYGRYSVRFKKFDMNICREASSTIGAWQPGSPPACLPSGTKKAKPAKPDAEHRIYTEHFGDLKAVKSDRAMADLQKSYQDKILNLHVRQRLGDEYLSKYLPILSKGQDELLQKKEVLDLQLSEQKGLSEDMINSYNKLFNASLAGFRSQMPRELYERFFGLSYDAQIDVRMFLPKGTSVKGSPKSNK